MFLDNTIQEREDIRYDDKYERSNEHVWEIHRG